MPSFDQIAANDPVAAADCVAAGRIPGPGNTGKLGSRPPVPRLYEKGMRVRLVMCDDPYTKLRVGERGTVDHIDDAGTIFVKWDSGSMLGMVPEAGDVIAIISMCLGGREITECQCADEDGHVDACMYEQGEGQV